MTARIPLVLVCLLAIAPLAAAAASPWNWTAVLAGENEVPARDTPARGVAKLALARDGSHLDYRLNVANIENVVASHIHLGPEGTSGPVVAFLFGNAPAGGGRSDGTLATGAITSGGLRGPLAGQTLADLLAAIEAGDAYVNVHTNDGVAPPNEGPGDFPGGEIRGQIG